MWCMQDNDEAKTLPLWPDIKQTQFSYNQNLLRMPFLTWLLRVEPKLWLVQACVMYVNQHTIKPLCGQ